MLALQALTPAALLRALPGASPSEARKLVSHVHRDGDFSGPVPQVRRVTLEALRRIAHVPALAVQSTHQSRLDPFLKLVAATSDGELVEVVRIPLEKPGRTTVCVSSQVGCALGCAFCATGRLGLRRNLEAWEIVEQVRLVRRTLGPESGIEPRTRVHGVVFQGMGEPLANLDRVLEAIDVLTDPSALAIDARNITVSTVGLPRGIVRLAEAAPRVRLAVSLHAARPEVRRRLLPLDAVHPLEEILAACAEHSRRTGYQPMWSCTLLAGINDGPEDAAALVALVRGYEARTGVRPRLSLIAYNDVPGLPFARPGAEREQQFRRVFAEAGLPTHRRYSGGHDVAAACGQLAATSG